MSANRSRSKASCTLLESISTVPRRRVLAILRDRAEPLDERALAGHLVASENDELETVPPAERHAVYVDLVQTQLPALEAAGLVERNEGEGTVTATDLPVFDDPWFRQFIEIRSDEWDDVIECLANDRRRVVLDVLADRDGSTAMEDLAEAVAARQTGVDETTDGIQAVRVSLHHAHLPKLADAELIEYDQDGRIVTYEGHSALDEERFDVPKRAPTDLAAATDAGDV